MQALMDLLTGTPAVRNLLLAAGRRSVAHSLILEVPDPSLGRALAEAFLAALYCTSLDPDGNPCGVCADCTQVLQGAHMGVVHVEPDGNELRVEQIHEDVLKRIGERVPGGRHQVFVLHGAECLNEVSGNALLKVIEEPPPATVFLLLTEDRNAILGTLRSRSQELVVPPPGLEGIVAGFDAEPAAAAAALLAAGLAPGVLDRLPGFRPGAPDQGELPELGAEAYRGLTDAEVLRDPRPTAHRPQVAEAVFGAGVEMLCRPEQWGEHCRRAHGYVDACGGEAKKRAKRIQDSLRELYGDGYQHPVLRRDTAFARLSSTRAAEDLLRALTAALASALRLGAGAEPFGLAGRYPRLRQLAARPAADLLGRARRVRRARDPLRRNQNVRLLFEELFLDLDRGVLDD